MMHSPNFSGSKRLDVLRDALADLPEALANVLWLLAADGRASSVVDVASKFSAMVRGTTTVQIVSSHPLDDVHRTRLENSLQRTTEDRLEFCYATDSTLLAGAIIRIGDVLWDASMLGRLRRLASLLTK